MSHQLLGWYWAAFALVCVGAALQAWGNNLAWIHFIHGHTRWPEWMWSSLTLLGFGWAAVIVVAAVDRRSGIATVAALLCLVVGGIGVNLLKSAFGLPRPGWVLDPNVFSPLGVPVLQGGSMPSGHALAATATATMLTLALQREGRWHWTTGVAIWLVAVLCAWSRVAVGAHWPADVIVGAGLGLALAAAAWTLSCRWAASRKGKTQFPVRMWVGLTETLAACVCLATDTGHPQAVLLQWSLGAMALFSAAWRWRSLSPVAPSAGQSA